MMQSTFGPTFRFFTNISQLVAYGYGAYLIINQELTVGELITFSLLLAQFSSNDATWQSSSTIYAKCDFV